MSFLWITILAYIGTTAGTKALRTETGKCTFNLFMSKAFI